MEACGEHLGAYLSKCRHILNKGYTNIHSTRLAWLNTFCLEFLKLSEKLHKFILLGNDKDSIERQGQVEVVYLCLTQIVTCIKHMENTIKAEDTLGRSVSASRQHFLDRIIWCLGRLRTCVNLMRSADSVKCSPAEENTFVDLMDTLLEQLSPYSSYKDESCSELTKVNINVAEDQARAMFVSKQIRSIVDLVLSHTLAFANVALKQDKKALSALCQKVLRECIVFQDECALGIQAGASVSDSNRKIKAISLENALYQLEDYINEALLRLVFTSFLDYKKLSVDKLRDVIKTKDAEDPELDELIADFDVNIDRTTQIGIFAIAFAPNVKIKTIVRSCLASFESLDSCIIPSLQSKVTSDAYAKLLEQHFNEEISRFKQAIQEIIDSQAFASCYQELLTQTISSNDKEYNKQSLQDIIEMGNFLHEHFLMAVNQKELRKQANRLEYLKKFSLMLTECQAVLSCSETEQVDALRILKRFKILRSVLRKFINELGGITTADGNPFCNNKSQVFIMSDEFSDSQRMFASIGISPSIHSILYNLPTTEARNRRLASDSLKGNYSKFPISPPGKINSILPHTANDTKNIRENPTPPPFKCIANVSGPQCKPFSIRRKQSLRTAMFKRQKSCETEEVYNKLYRNDSASLQISEILDQLTGLSSDFPEFVLEKSIISQ